MRRASNLLLNGASTSRSFAVAGLLAAAIMSGSCDLITHQLKGGNCQGDNITASSHDRCYAEADDLLCAGVKPTAGTLDSKGVPFFYNCNLTKCACGEDTVPTGPHSD
jgi:hypothetical protein